MKLRKICLSTNLCDLYGKEDYQLHLEVNREYWYFFDEKSDIFKLSGTYWNKLKITYIRSGCLFYIFPDYPDIKEDFCPVGCIMTSMFVFAEIDPIKDLGYKLDTIEIAKKLYYFDNEHTIVKNWPNETEIDSEELDLTSKTILEMMANNLTEK